MQETAQLFHPVIGGRVYLGDRALVGTDVCKDCHCFEIDDAITYVPICDDFGPMNLVSVMTFNEILENKLVAFPDQTVVFCVENNSRSLTNGAFLLGCYMILKMGLSPEAVWSAFSPIETVLSTYRDATFVEADFDLTLIDCWRGLSKANLLRWIDQFDMEEYCHYDNPLEGDLHMIVPDKLIAFQGPRTLPGTKTYHDEHGIRRFSPGFYVDIFHEMGVDAVVRLNEPHYSEDEFTRHGIECIGLEFADCTAPPPDVVVRFLAAVRGAKGAIAVHCKAGLGRTGTLIALYLMTEHGFTAREAIGWLRIVRPGSVIGEQQHFLCMIQQLHDHLHQPAPGAPAPPAPAPAADPPGWNIRRAASWQEGPAVMAGTAQRAAAAVRRAGSSEEWDGRAKARAAQVASALDSDVRTLRRAFRAAAVAGGGAAAQAMPMPELNPEHS